MLGAYRDDDVPEQAQQAVYVSDGLEIDLARRELRSHGVPVPLGSRAFEIIEVLVQADGELVNKYEVMKRVWPGAVVEENTLHFHISAVRKALGPDRGLLKTVFGRGYRLLGSWTIHPGNKPTEPVDVGLARRLGQSFQTNVPAAAFPLIGRNAATQHLLDVLSAYRVVTLTGPGGIGKSVLGWDIARNLFPTFEGDCWLIELASQPRPGLVPSTVAGVLGLRVGGDEISAAAVAQAIGERKLLLILDNCEHVIDAAAELAEALVRMCSHTTVLATSRESLRIDGEYVYRVSPLDVPPLRAEVSSDLYEYSAVQLFIARMITSASDFSPRQDNLATLAAICRRLDGIPLAIEFAAARAAALGLEQVFTRLDHRFRLLTAGRRTALPRHRTLRATLDWSYELLTESERRLLRRLAIFAGGFTLEGATAVTNEAEDPSIVAEGIASLVTKSLVAMDASAPSGRWRLLETIRAYAFDKLAEHGDAEQVARLHALFYQNLFVSIPPDVNLQPSIEGLSRQEIDNVRAALDWSFSPDGDSTIGVTLTAAYAPVWVDLSLMVECRERIERALDHLVEPQMILSEALRMQLHITLGVALIMTLGPVDRTVGVLTSALEAAEKLDDVEAQLRALWSLWVVHFNNGECHAALRTAEQFSRVAVRSRDLAAQFVSLRLIGNALQQAGQLDQAQVRFEHVIADGVGPTIQQKAIWYNFDQRALARAMLARGLWLRGFMEQAAGQAQTSIAEARGSDHTYTLCTVLRYAVNLVALMTGDLATAENATAMVIGLATTHNTPMWRIVGRFLEGRLLIHRGEFEAGTAVLRATFETSNKIGWTIGYPEFLCALAEGLAGLGRVAEGIEVVEQALDRADRGGEHWCVAELLRVKGELLLQLPADQSVRAAEECFERALDVAQEQGALFWELRVALSIARLSLRQDRPHKAQRVLAPIYERFTEGFNTADLRSASDILERCRLS
jgi:predicted ATPase/DNA-binding winged helix-turn-helix (wHTH) protein